MSVGRLLEAGQSAGAIRSDLDADDVMRAMSAIWMLSDTPRLGRAAERVRRLIMDGLRTTGR